MKYLKPLILKDSYWAEIEDEINNLFFSMFYQPFKELLQKYHISSKIITNSVDPLLDALKRSKIFYQDGKFYGEFNSRISKRIKDLGGKFNSVTKTWSLEARLLPPQVSTMIARANSEYAKLTEDILQSISLINVDEIMAKADTPRLYRKALARMNDDFVKAVQSVTIPPKITPETAEVLAAQWGQNLNLYIKGWADKNVISLRQQVAMNTYRGQRAENLVKLIEANYGSSRDKAKFLARQETSLLMSKLRQQRYQDIGSRRYRWSTSKDERVRHDHKILQGKVFSWDSPPVVDRATGRRAAPGEDFNCRCVAMPILGDGNVS